jgi:hypothetical protein
MKGVIWMIEVNCSEDSREPERWVAMNQPCYSLDEAKRKLLRLRNSRANHQMPRRIARYEAMEVIKG